MNLLLDFARRALIPYVGVSIKPSRGFNSAYPVSDAQQLAMAKQVGARIVRWDLPWSDVETSPGQFNWGQYATRFQLFKDAGIKSLIILGRGNSLYTPAWDAPPTTPAAIQAFCNYAVAAYKAFGASWACYEIYNEPNQAPYWNGTPDPVQYGALLGAVSTAIRAVRSDAIVISGGLGVNDPNTFIKTALQGVDKTKLSAIGFHPYTGADAYLTDPNMRPENVNGRLLVCKTNVGAGCPPAWNTEQGFELCKCAGTTLQDQLNRQGQFAARFVLSAMMSYQQFAIWYDLVDDGTDMTQPEQGFGLFDFNMKIKPAGIGFKSITDLLNNCTSASLYRDGDLYQAVFRMAGGDRTVTWSSNGQIPYTLTMDERKSPVIFA